jgi:hypothetical protein
MGQKLGDGKEHSLKVPGAGSYDPDYRAIAKSLPKYTMKGRSNHVGNKTNVPGPGAYDINLNNRRESPKFGFGSSTR